jgi:hypothetical protein
MFAAQPHEWMQRTELASMTHPPCNRLSTKAASRRDDDRETKDFWLRKPATLAIGRIVGTASVR